MARRRRSARSCSDYSRRGFFDGIGIRLPTISIRPGKPNRAASGFFSSILREPLIGEPPSSRFREDVRHLVREPEGRDRLHDPCREPRYTAARARRALTMPGLCATVGDQIDALRRAAGEDATRLIRREYNPRDRGHHRRLATRISRRARHRARLQAGQADFDEIIRVRFEDELASTAAI